MQQATVVNLSLLKLESLKYQLKGACSKNRFLEAHSSALIVRMFKGKK